MTGSQVHQVKTPVAGVDFFLRRMVVEEDLGRPFTFRVELYSEERDVQASKMLGKGVTISVELPTGGQRHFHGLVSQFVNLGDYAGYQVYEVILRPWLWFLSRTSDCRIFQQKNVPDILEDVFRTKNGFSDFRRALSETYRTWDYCVQYRETDLDFVNRLMEQEGIYYYFEHADGKHTLVLSDSISSHKAIVGDSKLPYRPPGDAFTGQEHVHTWLRTEQVQSGKYVLTDYDFENPRANLEVRSTQERQHALADLEVYDYPGEYQQTAEGNHYVRARLDALQAQHSQVSAEASCYRLGAGLKFNLIDYDRKSENAEYLILSARLEVEAGELEQLADDSERRCDVQFLAITSKQAFRLPRTTPKPIVAGPQTATVVGKKGEEIWTDEYGRVKVQFPWDRVGKQDENSSCWVRVAQVWAGKGWGGMHIPRIGQEVIVEFLEGDPDRPIITGRVYNADQVTPYKLPDNQTMSGLQSRSTKEGNAKTFNELRFEDKKGEEEIYFHAEKDFQRIVENNDSLKVGFDKKDQGDQTIEIHNNQKLVIGNDQSQDGSQTIEIWKDRTETVKQGNEKITIETGDREVVVQKGNDSHHVDAGNREVIVKGDDTHQVKQGNRSVTLDMGSDTLTVKQGDITTDAKLGKCTIKAMQSIELIVGSSSIKIEPAKITLSSPQISVSGSTKSEITGAIVKVAGSATTKIQGGLVKIN
jgi:type VI secretion system secreted protein VgrG